MNNNNCLVIGYGSAGARHAKNAQALGYEVSLVTSRQVDNYKCYIDLANVLTKEKPGFVIIASPTYRHVEELRKCIVHNVPCLVEKPLATSFSELRGVIAIDHNQRHNYRVAYCLRYHPMIQELISEISSLGRLYDARMVFGQYLPWWRSGTDYRKCYSASIEMGGGVLLDASHEIDLLTYLFGSVKKLVAVSKRNSSLEIKSDDLCKVIFEMESGQIVEISLDYFNQIPERRIVVNGENGSVHLDLVNMRYQSYVKNTSRIESYSVERNNLFIQELDDFINRRDRCLLPDLKESEITLRIIDAIRQSSREEEWINL